MVNQQERPPPKPMEIKSKNCWKIEQTNKHLRNSHMTWSPKDHILCIILTKRNSDFWKVYARWTLKMLTWDLRNEYFSNIWIVLLTTTTISSPSLQEMNHVLFILLLTANKNRWPESILIHLVPIEFNRTIFSKKK